MVNLLIVRVRIYPIRKEVIIEKPARRVMRVMTLLRELGYGVYEAVVVKGGKPLTEDDVIMDGDEVEVYEVRSAG